MADDLGDLSDFFHEVDEVRRGDILWIDCDPSLGVEPRKTRTCVVVSNDVANRFGQAVTVVPTQSYSRDRANRSYMVDLRSPRSTLRNARVANCSMVMTCDRRRIVRRVGRVSGDARQALDEALRVHLGLTAI